MQTFIRSTIILIALATPAAAQQPSQAQASAIRSACRGDYMTYCSSVPTGGRASLQCLQQNASSVSAGCQQALGAVGGGSAAAPPPPAATGATGEATAPPPPAYRPPPPAYQRPPPPPPPPPAMSPRQEMRILRGSCGYDFHRFCAGVQLGGGRGLACLKAYGPSLQPQCQSALLSLQGTR